MWFEQRYIRISELLHILKCNKDEINYVLNITRNQPYSIVCFGDEYILKYDCDDKHINYLLLLHSNRPYKYVICKELMMSNNKNNSMLVLNKYSNNKSNTHYKLLYDIVNNIADKPYESMILKRINTITEELVLYLFNTFMRYKYNIYLTLNAAINICKYMQ